MLEHHRAIAELLNETVPTLDGCNTLVNQHKGAEIFPYWRKKSLQPYHY